MRWADHRFVENKGFFTRKTTVPVSGLFLVSPNFLQRVLAEGIEHAYHIA
jgi:hypothetical protein